MGKRGIPMFWVFWKTLVLMGNTPAKWVLVHWYISVNVKSDIRKNQSYFGFNAS